MSPLWHISASAKSAPEFSRYGAYRRILFKEHFAGILLTGQYANAERKDNYEKYIQKFRGTVSETISSFKSR